MWDGFEPAASTALIALSKGPRLPHPDVEHDLHARTMPEPYEKIVPHVTLAVAANLAGNAHGIGHSGGTGAPGPVVLAEPRAEWRFEDFPPGVRGAGGRVLSVRVQHEHRHKERTPAVDRTPMGPPAQPEPGKDADAAAS